MTISAATTGAAEARPDPYDQAPYESFPFDFSEPQRLNAIGRLFGMTPSAAETCRMLELGCASGGNIVPLAVRYPGARFVGVDRSAVHIAHAQALAEAVDARNAVFHRMSIADIGADFGTFDVIVCHGVLSWVPPAVRESIFRVIRQCLSPQGIALVSYNTLPGWHQVRAIRDMLLYHTARFGTPEEKDAQGMALLRFVLDAIPPVLTSYREIVQNEINVLSAQHTSYVLHDHLEETNQPFYLHEVAAMAGAAGLDYLGDTALEVMFARNFPEPVAKVLASADDAVRTEQYMDFIANRRFRTSLFCRRSVTLKRNIDSGRIVDFHLGSRMAPVDPGLFDLTMDKTEKFTTPNGVEISTTNRYATALFVEIAGLGGRVVSAESLIRDAARRLPNDAAAADRIRTELVTIGLRLVFGGVLSLNSEPSAFAATVSAKPVAFPVAREVAKKSDWAPNLNHRKVNLGPGERVLLVACDGTRDLAQLRGVVADAVARGELNLSVDGGPAPDSARAGKAIEEWVGNVLANLARSGMLVG